MMLALFRNMKLLWRILIVLLIIIAGLNVLQLVLAILQSISDIILLFLGAWVIVFLLSPLVALLIRFKLPRGLATGIVYLAFTIVIVGLLILMIPVLSDQLTKLSGHVGEALNSDTLKNFKFYFIERLQSFGVSPKDADSLISQISSNLVGAIDGAIAYTLANAAGMISSVAWIMLETVIMLFLSFYMMLDGERLLRKSTLLLPIPWREPVGAIEENVTRIFGGFIRGQLLISLIYGLVTWITLFVIGVNDGFVYSLISALMMIIPFIGSYLAIVPPLLVTLIESNPGNIIQHTIIMFIILFVAQQIVFQGLAPRIMGQSIGLHPIVLIAALLVGAKIGGVWGAFFAAPFTALLIVFVRESYDRWRLNHPLFDESAQHGETNNATSALPSV
jgi:predicted PurR-regulated permease PerM